MTFGKQSHSNVGFRCCNVPCTPVKLNETIFEIYNFTKTLFQVPTNCPALFRNVKWRMAPYGDKVNSFGAVWGLWNGAENGHLNWAVCESCEIVWLLLFSKIMPNVHSCTNWPPEKPISSAFVHMCIFIRNGLSICNWRRMRTGWRRIRTNWRRTGNAEWRLLRTRLLAVFPIVKLGRKYWSNMERGHLKIMLRGWRFWFW